MDIKKDISSLHVLEMVLFFEAGNGDRTGFDTRLECFGTMKMRHEPILPN